MFYFQRGDQIRVNLPNPINLTVVDFVNNLNNLIEQADQYSYILRDDKGLLYLANFSGLKVHLLSFKLREIGQLHTSSYTRLTMRYPVPPIVGTMAIASCATETYVFTVETITNDNSFFISNNHDFAGYDVIRQDNKWVLSSDHGFVVEVPSQVGNSLAHLKDIPVVISEEIFLKMDESMFRQACLSDEESFEVCRRILTDEVAEMRLNQQYGDLFWKTLLGTGIPNCAVNFYFSQFRNDIDQAHRMKYHDDLTSVFLSLVTQRLTDQLNLTEPYNQSLFEALFKLVEFSFGRTGPVHLSYSYPDEEELSQVLTIGLPQRKINLNDILDTFRDFDLSIFKELQLGGSLTTSPHDIVFYFL